jgi:hypothetical protein
MRVHNISDRPNTDTAPYAIELGGTVIRPGKFADISDSLKSARLLALHGKVIWIGNELPSQFRKTSQSSLRSVKTEPLTREEIHAVLAKKSREELIQLFEHIAPTPELSGNPSVNVLQLFLVKLIHSEKHILDPEKFFWLGRWERKGDTFIRKG